MTRKSLHVAAPLAAVACALLGSDLVHAHHAPTEYDFRKIVVMEGRLVEVRWKNPHVRILMQTSVDATGKPVIVDIEGSALSVLRRTNATPEGLRIGDEVKVAGHPSRRDDGRVWGLNLLQADGKELLFHPGIFPRWQKDPLGAKTNWFDQRDLDTSSTGIFRVWSSKFDEFLEWNPPKPPLTEPSRRRADAWDPLTQSVTHGCAPIGMPTIMDNPYPLEFVRQGDAQILLRMEIYDAVRTIHLGKLSRDAHPPGIFGRSIGHWEGNTLVVATDGITWSYFDHLGTPLSPAVSIIERFTPTADNSRLQYKMVVTDPETFTQPIELTRTWIARKGESLKPYECSASESEESQGP